MTAPTTTAICPECGCEEDDHHFGDSYRDFAAQLFNDGEGSRDGPNPCGDCCNCPRDEEGN